MNSGSRLSTGVLIALVGSVLGLFGFQVATQRDSHSPLSNQKPIPHSAILPAEIDSKVTSANPAKSALEETILLEPDRHNIATPIKSDASSEKSAAAKVRPSNEASDASSISFVQRGSPIVAPPVVPSPAQTGVARPVVAQPAVPLNPNDFSPEEIVNIHVYENVNRSVVNISTKVVSQQLLLFGAEQFQEGAGSGSVIDKKGHILTNYHVIENAREIEVALYDGNSYPAKLVGADPTNDTAVIKIDAPAESLVPIQFGDSGDLRVGQRVLAIGNPFGLERTLTTGIISSLNRSIPARNGRIIKSIIQIDAAINPGNSGGPLLDSRGRMIGMNTAIQSKVGQSAGVGFTIPVNTINRVVPSLIENGRVIRPETGITRVFQTDKGLLVATLAPNGPAAMAGLRGIRVVREKKRNGPLQYETETVDRTKADLIVGVDGQKTKTADDFLTKIEMHKVGDEVVLNLIREGREMTARLKLGGGE